MPKNSFFMYPDNDSTNISDNDSDNNYRDDYQNNSNNNEIDINYNVNYLLNFIWKYILLRFIGILWYIIKKIPSFITFVFIIIYSLFGYYLMWISLHYAAVHMYPIYCAPLNLVGFILSPFMISAPHCIAMRWLIMEGSNVIITMWVTIGAYIIQILLRRSNNVQ